MNKKQADILTKLVNLNYIITLHSITPEYIFLSIACIDQTFIPLLVSSCYPLTSEFRFDGNKVSGYIYKK